MSHLKPPTASSLAVFILCLGCCIGTAGCSTLKRTGSDDAVKTMERQMPVYHPMDAGASISGEADETISTMPKTEVDEEESDSSDSEDTELQMYRTALGIDAPPKLETAPLEAFFDALSETEMKRDAQLVRVIHFGDSHTAADILPSMVRRTLQDRFGDGGRGFVFIGKPWRTYRLVDAVIDARGNWQTHRVYPFKRASEQDGRYGIGGVAVSASKRGASVSLGTSTKTSYSVNTSLFEIFYLKQPNGGTFSVLVDGRRTGKVRTLSNRYTTGFKRIELEDGPHRIDLRLKGDGKVRLFGAVMERGGPGVAYDVAGINGAFFYTSLRWDNVLFRDQMLHRAPNLVIAMYGANEADSRKLTRKEYTRRVRKAMSRFTEAAPNASCLLLGPMDRKLRRTPERSDEKLNLIIQVQSTVAEELGCGFLDLRELMGGPGAIEKWKREGLAQQDNVHLTMMGYRVLGKIIGAQLLEAYDRYQTASPDHIDEALQPQDENAGVER